MAQVPKYSQQDVLRLQQDAELEFQARLLAKERDWAKRAEGQRAEWERSRQPAEGEKNALQEKIQRLTKSHEDMK